MMAPHIGSNTPSARTSLTNDQRLALLEDYYRVKKDRTPLSEVYKKHKISLEDASLVSESQDMFVSGKLVPDPDKHPLLFAKVEEIKGPKSSASLKASAPELSVTLTPKEKKLAALVKARDVLARKRAAEKENKGDSPPPPRVIRSSPRLERVRVVDPGPKATKPRKTREAKPAKVSELVEQLENLVEMNQLFRKVISEIKDLFDGVDL